LGKGPKAAVVLLGDGFSFAAVTATFLLVLGIAAADGVAKDCFLVLVAFLFLAVGVEVLVTAGVHAWGVVFFLLFLGVAVLVVRVIADVGG
jgi:hypothetical protein